MKNTFVKSICLLTGCLLLSQDGNTPTNLQIDAASVGGVTLSWDVPENYQKQWASHSNFIFQWGIGNQSLTPASYFHKFPDSLLADYHNMLVKQIAFVPSSISSWQPFVFQTDPNAPGDVPDLINYSNCVLSAPSSVYFDNFFSWKVHTLYNHVPGTSSNPFENDVDLSTFRIDSTKTLWYGYTVSDYQPYPAGSDVGPALEGLGNVIVYCGNQGCGETTLNQNAADGYTLDNNWMLAISLVTGDSTRANESAIILSSNTIPNRRMPSFVNSINPSMSIVAGARREIALFPIEELSREISNYFVFENGQVADVVQPTSNTGFNTTNREGTILGPRDPGFYYYYVKAQTASGVSEPSNTVSVDIQNNSPTEFSLIAPEAGALVSVTHTNINNTISFIWTNSVDTDGQEIYFTLDICKDSGDLACYDTTMTDRIYQPTAQDIIDSLDLSIGTNLLSWSVFVSDGIDTVLSDDSTRYLTLAIEQLGNELSALQPNRFSLHQNYPNPFNPVTKITFELAKSEFVSLNVYDVNGNLVKNLINREKVPGEYDVNWDGTNNAKENVAGGVYFYRIDTDSYSSTKKMILLK